MSSETTNLHLVKPTSADTADIGIINGNMDIIDSAVADCLPLSGGTMTGETIASGTQFTAKSTNVTNDSTSTSVEGNGRVYWTDSNGLVIGRMHPWMTSDGTQRIRILSRRRIGSSDYYNGLNLGIDGSGNAKIVVEGTGVTAAWRSAIGVSSIIVTRVCSPSSAVSFAANTTTDFTIPITAVSGYTPIAVSGFRISYAKLLPLQVRIENATTISMTVQSFWTSAVSTANIGISVLYFRNELL